MKTKKITSLVLAALMGSTMFFNPTNADAAVYAEAYNNVSVITGTVPVGLRYTASWAGGSNFKAILMPGTEVIVTGESVGQFTPVYANGMYGYVPSAHVVATNAKVYVYTDIATYMNADDAKAGKNALGYYEAGYYFLYKTASNGMINISPIDGQAGRWVNPLRAEDPQDVKVTIADSLTYMDAANAFAETNRLPGYYAAGTYYVYKDAGNGILNVSKVKGEAGRWINLNATKTPENTLYRTLDREYFTYMNADDAKAGTNALAGTYGPGKYIVYKDLGNGIVNLTKVAGEPGRWLNLNETTAPISSITLEREYLTYMNADDAAAEKNALNAVYPAGTYYVYRQYNGMLNISTIKGQPGRWINPDAKKFPPVYEAFYLNSEVFTYMSAEDAEAEKNALSSTYKPGDYFIFKKVSDTIVNISKVKGEAGRWVNLDPSKIPGVTDVKTIALSDTFVSAEDAAALVNPTGRKYAAGTYFIYKNAGNGIYNLTTVKGQPGSWINTITPEVPSKPAPEVEKVVVPAGTKRYKSAADAIAGVNSVGTYPTAVELYIYKVAGSGVVNVTSVEGQPGSWVVLQGSL